MASSIIKSTITTAQVESFSICFNEWITLIDCHYDELSLHKDMGIPLSPQFHEYFRRESIGSMLYVTLRSGGILIGYLIGFIAPSLHYHTCLTCMPDIFFIHPEHRGGVGAFRLFRCAERELRRRGVQAWFIGSKNHRDSSRLFRALGFDAVETIHCKWLKGH